MINLQIRNVLANVPYWKWQCCQDDRIRMIFIMGPMENGNLGKLMPYANMQYRGVMTHPSKLYTQLSWSGLFYCCTQKKLKCLTLVMGPRKTHTKWFWGQI